jgi:hypothetical protein
MKNKFELKSCKKKADTLNFQKEQNLNMFIIAHIYKTYFGDIHNTVISYGNNINHIGTK